MSRCFILGNSGELLDHDLNLLKGETVFGCNALPLHNSEIITHYVCLDMNMAFLPEIRSMVKDNCIKYYSRLVWNTIDNEDNVRVFDTYPSTMSGFAFSDSMIYEGDTVAYSMLQIASALGYDDIYMLGVDCGTPSNGIMSIPEQAKMMDLLKSKNLRNPTRDKTSIVTTHDDMTKRVNKHFLLARHKLNEVGVMVYNLSTGSKLNCFPRKVYEDVLNGNHETEIVSDVELSNKGE